ncbi:MAG TPA: HAD-IA family hydrolase [Blastocatellia bacterium]|nr:HAD-IA family hydrolase [Blastocatellia bacterium]
MTREHSNIRQFVFLDAGGTLLRIARLEEILAEVCEEAGFHIAPEEMRPILERAMGRMTTPGPTSLDLQAHRRWWTEFVEGVLDEVGFTGSRQQVLAQLWRDYRSGHWVGLFPDTVEALDLLSEHGWRLGVISNWDDTLEEFLDRLQISRYFEVVVSSYRVGYEKPDVRIFEHALTVTKAHRESSWFVGDNLELDHEGAQQAGLRTILVDYDGYYSELERTPCPVVRSLKEAAQLIIGSQSGAP